jgi:drug/metabolite transporter (DMT)-like permease
VSDALETPAFNEQRWDDCVSNLYRNSKRHSPGYAFFVLGGVLLLLHHVWVAGFRQEQELEVLWVGCFLVLFNAMGWAAPATFAGIEGRAKMPRWKGFVWFVVLCVLGAAVSWAVGRYVYGVNLLG